MGGQGRFGGVARWAAIVVGRSQVLHGRTVSAQALTFARSPDAFRVFPCANIINALVRSNLGRSTSH